MKTNLHIHPLLPAGSRACYPISSPVSRRNDRFYSLFTHDSRISAMIEG
jgi:hypothetical protein